MLVTDWATLPSPVYILDWNKKKKKGPRWAWWRMPLIPAPGRQRQRQVDFWVQGQPGLQSEFQDSQDYTEKPCLGKKKKKGPSKSMFIIILATTARAWNQSSCPSRNEWIKNIWYIHKRESYSVSKEKKMKFYLFQENELGVTMLSEIKQTLTAKSHLFSLICRISRWEEDTELEGRCLGI